MNARTPPPITRTSPAPKPLAYLSAVSGPCVRIHGGNRNHARGEASMKAALMTMMKETTAQMHQLTI
ncbi:MAG: hypothetical protein ABSF45_15220 [Terriglobia bacterium]